MTGDELIRIKSGIPGLDDMMEGGFPFPSTVLVAGSAGIGKTTFALQFLAKGAAEGQKGIFFTTLSETPAWMLRFLSRYTFLDKAAFDKYIKYVDLGPQLREQTEPGKILEYIEEQINDFGPQRLIIDPLTVVGDLMKGNYRTFLYDLTTHLKNWQAVSILTGEVLPSEPYPVEVSYIVDTVILLNYGLSPDGGRRKYIEILKMRGTQHVTGQHLINISKDGFMVQVGLR
jgi:circadian clock protein KaiC